MSCDFLDEAEDSFFSELDLDEIIALSSQTASKNGGGDKENVHSTKLQKHIPPPTTSSSFPTKSAFPQAKGTTTSSRNIHVPVSGGEESPLKRKFKFFKSATTPHVNPPSPIFDLSTSEIESDTKFKAPAIEMADIDGDFNDDGDDDLFGAVDLEEVTDRASRSSRSSTSDNDMGCAGERGESRNKTSSSSSVSKALPTSTVLMAPTLPPKRNVPFLKGETPPEPQKKKPFKFIDKSTHESRSQSGGAKSAFSAVAKELRIKCSDSEIEMIEEIRRGPPLPEVKQNKVEVKAKTAFTAFPKPSSSVMMSSAPAKRNVPTSNNNSPVASQHKRFKFKEKSASASTTCQVPPPPAPSSFPTRSTFPQAKDTSSKSIDVPVPVSGREESSIQKRFQCFESATTPRLNHMPVSENEACTNFKAPAIEMIDIDGEFGDDGDDDLFGAVDLEKVTAQVSRASRSSTSDNDKPTVLKAPSLPPKRNVPFLKAETPPEKKKPFKFIDKFTDESRRGVTKSSFSVVSKELKTKYSDSEIEIAKEIRRGHPPLDIKQNKVEVKARAEIGVFSKPSSSASTSLKFKENPATPTTTFRDNSSNLPFQIPDDQQSMTARNTNKLKVDETKKRETPAIRQISSKEVYRNDKRNEDWNRFFKEVGKHERRFNSHWFQTIPIPNLNIIQWKSLVSDVNEVSHLTQISSMMMSALKGVQTGFSSALDEAKGTSTNAIAAIDEDHNNELIALLESVFVKIDSVITTKSQGATNVISDFFKVVLENYSTGQLNFSQTTSIFPLIFKYYPEGLKTINFTKRLEQAIETGDVEVLTSVCFKNPQNLVRVINHFLSDLEDSQDGYDYDVYHKRKCRAMSPEKLCAKLIDLLFTKLGTSAVESFPFQMQALICFEKVVLNEPDLIRRPEIIEETFTLVNYSICQSDNVCDCKMIEFLFSALPKTNEILNDKTLTKNVTLYEWPYLWKFLKQYN